jgi:hypothetical protein
MCQSWLALTVADQPAVEHFLKDFQAMRNFCAASPGVEPICPFLWPGVLEAKASARNWHPSLVDDLHAQFLATGQRITLGDAFIQQGEFVAMMVSCVLDSNETPIKRLKDYIVHVGAIGFGGVCTR